MGLVDGVFHADPHPGNLSVTDEGRLVIYDYGMSQRLSPQEQDDITSLYRTLVRRDVDGLEHAHRARGPRADGRSCRGLTGPRTADREPRGRSDITWRAIITELFARLHEFPFRIPPNVMLLVRVGTVGEGVCRTLDPEFDFIAATRSFLVDYGIIESELEALFEDVRADLRESAPVLARAPARFDSVFGQLERGELVVRTDPVDPPSGGDPAVGYAIVAGSLFVAAAVLTFHELGSSKLEAWVSRSSFSDVRSPAVDRLRRHRNRARFAPVVASGAERAAGSRERRVVTRCSSQTDRFHASGVSPNVGRGESPYGA